MVGVPECAEQVDFGRRVFDRVHEIRGVNTRMQLKLWRRQGIKFIGSIFRVELERSCERQMECNEKTNTNFVLFAGRFAGNKLDATPEKIQRLIIDGRSGQKIHYTDDKAGEKLWLLFGAKETRSTWCTMCAEAEKCASFTLHVLAKREESLIKL